MASQTFSIERVVAFLGPFFAAGATFVTGYVAQRTGIKLDATALAIIETGAFLGTVSLVCKWLHGRQIPAIAGLHATQAQYDELHDEIAAYLKAHGTELDKRMPEQVGDVVRIELDRRIPQLTPDVDVLVSEVLKRLATLAAAAPPGALATPGAAPAQ